MLVEVVRFRVFDFETRDRKKRWLPPHYAAWVVPAAGGGTVRIVDLGPAARIEEAVSAFLAAATPDRDLLRTKGEAGAEAQVGVPLKELSRLVLTLLLPHIGTSKTWLVSPDAALWLVPWAALPLADDRYAVEEYSIRYLVSGRDLIGKAAPLATGVPAILADPDYDQGGAQVREATRRLFQMPAPGPSVDLPTSRGLSGSFVGTSAPRLRGTAAEAKAIAPKLKEYAGAEPMLYTDQWALESVFKALARPKVVVLSTHGFFLRDETEEARPEGRPYPRSDPSGRPPGLLPENPLLRCGLLLSGANTRLQPSLPGDEDGVLTGLEIVGTDLRGTDLVVLSACETGLGKVRAGDGVAGLRQAFQFAGARSVVATLWQVPDAESARLMAGFFEQLAAGRSKTDALRTAQLAIIQTRRARHGGAHPFFWAAYTLTGP